MVAATLGNTPAICRDYYIHPVVIDAYQEGVFFDVAREASETIANEITTNGTSTIEEERQVEERIVLHLLRRHLAQEPQ